MAAKQFAQVYYTVQKQAIQHILRIYHSEVCRMTQMHCCTRTNLPRSTECEEGFMSRLLRLESELSIRPQE